MAISAIGAPVRHSRLRSIVAAALGVTMIAMTMIVSLPAMAAGSWVRGMPIPGGTGWLGTWIPYQGQPVPGLCVQANAVNPSADVVVTPGQLNAQPSLNRPADLSVDIPQMAYIMKNWMPTSLAFSDSDLDAAAVGFLAHVNFENAGARSQSNVDSLIGLTPANIQDRARQMVAAAQAAGVVAWEPGEVTGTGTRFGTIDGIGVKNASNAYVAGKPFTITFTGPVVFDATGTNTYSSSTAATRIDGIKWHSIGNGKANYSIKYDDLGASQLGYASPGGGRQDVIYPYDDATPRSETAQGPTWDVIFDFQPVGESDVAEARIVEAGTPISDTFTAAAKADYGDGKWLELDGKGVPVTYEGTAYWIGERPAAKSDSVPTDAKALGSVKLTFDGPGTQTATLDGVAVPSGFVTWVWKVVKADQSAQVVVNGASMAASTLVHGDWSDAYGADKEITSNRFPVEINTAISSRVTKAGTYLVDDVWVDGFPSDHPDFAGDRGFGADVKTMDQSLLFFPKGLDVTEVNKAQATVIATVTLPAKNGFNAAVGSTKFKVDPTESGTYVFVTSFAGDDRVKPLNTSVEDTTEQFTVEGVIPTLKTTATDKADGDKELATSGTVTVSDKVCYTGLKPGAEYELTATLMDKETGKPFVDSEGNTVQATVKHTPTKADDCTTVHITVDASVLAGKTTVVFEDLTRDGKTVATHADINDEGQTVKTPGPKLGTTATDHADGDKTLAPNADVVLDDKVCYENLAVGKEYELSGTLMSKATGKELLVNGKTVTSSVEFTPTEAKGCQIVSFHFNTSGLAGQSIVVFEKASVGGVEVATHADINDEGQTVKVDSPKPTLPVTGTDAAFFGVTSLVVLGVGVTILGIRRRQLV